MIRPLQKARDNHPGARIGDEGAQAPTWWRGVYLWLRSYVLPATAWSFLASCIAVWALILGVDNQDRIQQGRRDAINVTCAVESAVSEAGRNVIGNAISLPPATERLLHLPPFSVREAQAQRQANRYVQSISAAVESKVGHRGDRLVRPDGTLDCRVLQRIAQTR